MRLHILLFLKTTSAYEKDNYFMRYRAAIGPVQL